MNNYQKKLYKYLGFLNDLTVNVYMKTTLKNHSTPYSLDEFQFQVILQPESSELAFYSLDVSVSLEDFETFLDTSINRFWKRMDKFEAIRDPCMNLYEFDIKLVTFILLELASSRASWVLRQTRLLFIYRINGWYERPNIKSCLMFSILAS